MLHPVERENENWIYDLVAMSQSSDEKNNCMRKRYYNYDLKEWTIQK